MRSIRTLVLGALTLVLVSACSAGGGSPSPSSAASAAPGSAAASAAGTKAAIRIGSDGFYESKLMGEIYAQALEANGYPVTRDLGLGARKVTAAALDSGQFDLKPEYIGSGLAFYGGTATGDPAANATALQAALTPKNITVLAYTPAQDQNAFVVRKDTADQYKLTKMSDLTAVQDKLKFGLATDCPTNPVCGAALKTAYGIDTTKATLLSACDAPMAQALLAKTIDVAELCSTQPDIAVNGWVLLQDDKQTQPADNIAPIVRDDYLAKVDKAAFSKILNDVSAKMDTATLLKLGTSVSVDKKDIADVAKQWLKDNGFVQ